MRSFPYLVPSAHIQDCAGVTMQAWLGNSCHLLWYPECASWHWQIWFLFLTPPLVLQVHCFSCKCFASLGLRSYCKIFFTAFISVFICNTLYRLTLSTFVRGCKRTLSKYINCNVCILAPSYLYTFCLHFIKCPYWSICWENRACLDLSPHSALLGPRCPLD